VSEQGVRSSIADEDVLACFPDAWVDLDTLPFFRGLMERALLVNRCEDCARWHQPPWPMCPYCNSSRLVPTEVGGGGRVHSFTRPPGAPATFPGFAVIELQEQADLRASATLVECEPSDVHIGMPVKLTWIERDGRPLPAFRPA
jgi:uncharacterized OB-fold protein